MWYLNEVLVVALPDANLLLPAVVLANDERSNAFPYQQLDNPVAVGVQVVVNLARPSRVSRSIRFVRRGCPSLACSSARRLL